MYVVDEQEITKIVPLMVAEIDATCTYRTASQEGIQQRTTMSQWRSQNSKEQQHFMHDIMEVSLLVAKPPPTRLTQQVQILNSYPFICSTENPTQVQILVLAPRFWSGLLHHLGNHNLNDRRKKGCYTIHQRNGLLLTETTDFGSSVREGMNWIIR